MRGGPRVMALLMAPLFVSSIGLTGGLMSVQAQDTSPHALLTVECDTDWLPEPGGVVTTELTIVNDNSEESIELSAFDIAADKPSMMSLIESTCRGGTSLQPGEGYSCTIVTEIVGEAGDEVILYTWVEANSESGAAVSPTGWPGDPLELACSIHIRTGATGTIEGVVRDGATGELLDGVRVVAQHVELGFQDGDSTSGVGSYQLSGLEPGLYRLGAGNSVDGSSHTHVGLFLDAELAPGEHLRVDWELRRGAVCSGRVVNVETGEPVRDADVCLRSTDGGSMCSSLWQTDIDGWWEIVGFTGDYRIEVRAEGYEEFLSEPIMFEYDATIDLPIALVPADSVPIPSDTPGGLPFTGLSALLLASMGGGITLAGLVLTRSVGARAGHGH